VRILGVIFDLDGVILSTDEYHYLAWLDMAKKENIYFDREINERLRGVSRMDSLEIVLERSTKKYSQEEKIKLCEYKNNKYRALLEKLSPKDIFPGATDFLKFLLYKKIKIAIGSSSKNAKYILKKIELYDMFDGHISDGTNITKSKPDPEVFTKAAEMLKINPCNCLVIEDAYAGIEAAKKGGMIAMGIGSAKDCSLCDLRADDISSIDKSIFE